MEKLAEEVMRQYMEVLLERMKNPDTPLLEINDGIRLITMHFVKIRNAADAVDRQQLAQNVFDRVHHEFSSFCSPKSDPKEQSLHGT